MRPRALWLAVAVLVVAGLTGSTQARQGVRIPLRAGLMIVTAINEVDRGDYESIKTILRADAKEVSLRYNSEAPAPKAEDNPFAAILGGGEQQKPTKNAEGKEVLRVNTVRTVSREDLKSARHYQHLFSNNSPERYPGTTAVGLSSAIFTELKTKGQAPLTVQATGLAGQLGSMLGGLLGGLGAGAVPGKEMKELEDLSKVSGTLKRVEAAPVPFKVIVNDVPVTLPAVHAKGQVGDFEAEFWILDDVDNPLSLKWIMGHGQLQVIKLQFPAPAETTTAGGGAGSGAGAGGGGGAGAGGSGAGAARIEKALEEAGRAVVYGIYFDFASDRIKEESEPVLKEIADVMTKNPTWNLTVEGHTDSIGTNEANQDLSQRRAAAVRKALGDRYKIAAPRLVPAGFGESRPQDTNETIEGRARNRRVELARIGR
jgi:outer membrane protein OmpA-like peptidoglycan-associated protein